MKPMEEQSCCAPAGTSTSTRESAEAPQRSARQPRGQVRIPGGHVRDGRRVRRGVRRRRRATGPRGPPRRRSSIDATAVTNAQFATFVKATGHVTEAEEFGLSAVFHLAVQAAAAADVLHRAAGTPWWLAVRGADWRHPAGPRLRHRRPAEPPGRARLLARRPGLLPLGRQAAADRGRVGVRRPRRPRRARATPGATSSPRRAAGSATSGRATFPRHNTEDDGFLTTAPAKSFAPNGYGLYCTGRQRVGVVRRLVLPDVLRAVRRDRATRTGPDDRRSSG